MTFNKMQNSTVLGVAVLALLAGCGRSPSSLLRQGQLPLNDFPMYLSDGAEGIIWKLDEDGSRSELVTGLTDPRGLATDRFDNLYVVEYGSGRLLKIDPDNGDYEVIRENLSEPSIVAVDSFNEVFVTQDGEQNIIRASDGEVIAKYDGIPSALVFGVDDVMVVGLYSENTVFWDSPSNDTEVQSPVNAAIDATGRVFISEGLADEGRILRYHQQEPGGSPTEVATGLQSPTGTAVDSVGNMYIVEQAGGRIVLVTHQGDMYEWGSGFLDPQYLALTKY